VLAALTLLAGLGFKLSLIPFHAWTPPTFATAPLPITALLAATSKIAALAALLVVLTPFARVIEGTPRPHALAFGIGTLAAVSFLIGTVVAFRATDAVRLLAWSTIAQAGWVVLPLAALTASAHRAAAGYVLTYAAASLVAFAAVSAVRATTDGEPGSRRELTAYKGLVRTHPHIGGPLVLALLVLAGLPPGILGLVAKVVALRPLLEAGLWPLAVVAVIGVVVGIAVYLRWIALLLAAPDAQPQARPAVHAGPGALVVLAIGTALLIVASVVPQVLYGLLS
jgi:NADH-quinone oxidoreductase subunit N